jgi:hypothetical protein
VPITAVLGSFTDTEPAPISDDWALIEAAYADLLGRGIDQGGLAYWRSALAQGVSRTTFVGSVVGSEEWSRRTVGQLYTAYLGRAASPGETGYWATFVQGGALDLVRASLLGSGEYFSVNGNNNDAFVTALYEDVLGRPADAAGRASVLQRLAQGQSRGQVAGSAVGSDEAHGRLADGFITTLLDRAPGPGDRDYGIAVMRGGLGERAYIVNLVASFEYLVHLPNAYGARVSIAGGAPVQARVQRAENGSYEVVSPRAIGSTGTFDVDIVVTKSGSPAITIDSTVEVISPRNERWLGAAYDDLFARGLDPGAAVTWMPRLATGGPGSRGAVTALLLASPEGRFRLVDGIYDEYLGRSPNSGEAAYWAGVLGGAPMPNVRALILGSGERFFKSGSTNAGWLDSIYPLILGRGPDGAGRGYYLGLLDAGAPRPSVAGALLGSGEAGGHRAARLYTDLLDRAPSSGERQFWGGQMAAGISEQAVMAGLLASTERFDRYPPPPP